MTKKFVLDKSSETRRQAVDFANAVQRNRHDCRAGQSPSEYENEQIEKF